MLPSIYIFFSVVTVVFFLISFFSSGDKDRDFLAAILSFVFAAVMLVSTPGLTNDTGATLSGFEIITICALWFIIVALSALSVYDHVFGRLEDY